MIQVEIQGVQLIITNTVVDIFMKFRQLYGNDNERGGILLGQVNDLNNKVLICRAGIPSNADRGGRTSFRRNHVVAQNLVEYEFYNSDGKNTYLGEWHTHPAKVASPSSQDVNMIKQQFVENDIKVNFVLMIIVAYEEIYVGMYNGNDLNSVVISTNTFLA